MENTKIEWATHTYNPWTGCTNISPACDNCYAESWANRWDRVKWGPHGERQRTSVQTRNKPYRWEKLAANLPIGAPRPRVFCSSLADVFDNHKSILPEWREELYNVIAGTPHLDWLLLTKRPQNVMKYIPEDWVRMGWPPNVWIGTTVENQEEYDKRIYHLRLLPARVRFLSMEPLLGPVAFGSMVGINWVICGGESGANARPMNPDWVRGIRNQCRLSKVPFHFKQWGEWLPFGEKDADGRTNLVSKGKKPGFWHEWPGSGISVRVGKKNAGRHFDSMTYNEAPELD